MGGRSQLSNPSRRVPNAMHRAADDGPHEMRDQPSPGGRGQTGGLRATLSWQHLVGVTFFAVCGGAYGIEDSVGAGGPRLTLLGVLVLPWVWSLPIALMTAELGSMIPEAGGYVIWVHRAFGPFWAQQNAVWNLVSNTFDNALYPVMFVDYLGWFPAMRLQGGLRWLVSILMLGSVTLLNMLGVDVVANASNLFAIFVISPFIALVVAGAFALPPSAWFYGLSSGDGADPIRWGTFLSVLLWNTSGYDSVGALAAEVQDPGRDLPCALIVTIVLVTLTYLLPLLLAISLDSEHVRSWSDGDFVIVASQHIGDWLAAWITIGGALSALGLLNTLLCTSARVAVSAAKLRILPASLAQVHEQSGTPRKATVTLSLFLAVACALPFSQLVSISMLFYGATTFFEFLALLKLRRIEPHTPRPFSVGLSFPMLVLCCLPPMALCLLLICLAPWEAWALFGASTVAGVAASIRTAASSGAPHNADTGGNCFFWCRWLRFNAFGSKCAGGNYGTIELAGRCPPNDASCDLSSPDEGADPKERIIHESANLEQMGAAL